MNCEPGDLAIVVRELGANSTLRVGNIVQCMEFRSHMMAATDDVIYRNVWLVSKGRQLVGPNGHRLGTTDDCLRPIRPGDLQDEVIASKELEAA